MPWPINRSRTESLPVLAAGGNAIITPHRHAPTSMGPGVKPRDDSGVCGDVTLRPYRSASASRSPSSPKAPAKPRRIHRITPGRAIT